MKRILIGFLTTVFIVCLQGPIMAAQPKPGYSVVTGKGDPSVDVIAVQKAVDRGGSVELKGNFDFGKDGNVIISKDVNIFGETDAQGAPVTKIQGGFWTFQSKLPEQLPPPAPGPKISILGIHFDGALWCPINLTYCSGANIVGNKITNVRPIPSKRPIFGKMGLSRQKGIAISGHQMKPGEKPKHIPEAITGILSISDNEIDLTNETPEKTMAQGVFVLGSTGATVKITGNSIMNCSLNSIEALDNYNVEDGNGIVIIKDNRIITSSVGVPVPSPSTPNGILVAWFLDLTGASDPVRRDKVIVVDNQIETRGETSSAITVISDEAVIASNDIRLKGGPKAKAIVQLSSDGVIADNKIEGSGFCGVMVTPFKHLKGNRNTLVGNDFNLFHPTAANVLLQSSDNVVMGKCGKVIDKAQGNQILK